MKKKIEYKKVKLTATQRKNLLKLATYLIKTKIKKDSFDMFSYSKEDIQTETNCGSVGCAIGHGPYAGIKKNVIEDWTQYSYRVFISDFFKNYWTPENLYAWEYMFSYAWKHRDNTPKGAGKRILHILRNGLPNNHREQRIGLEPRSYTKETI